MLELGEHSLSVKISAAKSDEIFENISSLLTDEINNRQKFLTDEKCSIETFDIGVILVFEMIVCLNNLSNMKRFQITQFEGYFYIA